MVLLILLKEDIYMEALKIIFDAMTYVSLGLWGWVALTLGIMAISFLIEKVVKFTGKTIAKLRRPRAAQEIE